MLGNFDGIKYMQEALELMMGTKNPDDRLSALRGSNNSDGLILIDDIIINSSTCTMAK